MMALNAKTKNAIMMALNAKTENYIMTLNAELRTWLRIPNYEEMVALNAKLKIIA